MNRSQFTLMDLLRILASRVLVILLAGVVAGAGAWAYTTYRIPKMYRTSVTFYAQSRVSEAPTQDVTTTVQNASKQLASTYSYVLQSNLVMKDAAEKLAELGITTPGGGKYTYTALKAMISITTTNTEIFTVTFSSSDLNNLQTIANTVSELGATRIQELVGGEARIIDSAEAPGSPYSPNVRANTVTGLLVGLLIAAAVVVIRALTDTTIWNEEDLTRQFDIPVLGSVPQISVPEAFPGRKE